MKQHICQSCGMPMTETVPRGTDEYGLPIQDYCNYCFKDGKFTSDVTMEEMIQLCSKYVESNTREHVIANMKLQFPTLKRWARKENTQNEYYKSINKVLDYIHAHLDENPDLETLSGIANISTFHFHRIFKNIIGENLGEYVQRLRLEYVAGQLRTTDFTLNLLADRVGYKSEQALSKAFKKYFGIPPSTYKNAAEKCKNDTLFDAIPSISTIDSQHAVYIRVIDEYGNPESYKKAWKKLYLYAVMNGLFTKTSRSLGISFDDPTVTSPEKCRFYACITTENPVKPSSLFGYRLIEGGLYAIFTHKGSYSGLLNLYKFIWFDWLASGKYKLRRGVSFENYLNNPDQVEESEILTEIYIPVQLKK